MLSGWDKIERYLVKTRYSNRDAGGNPLEETYDDVINRVVNWLKSVYRSTPIPINDMELDSIEYNLRSRIILPATPVLMNVGVENKNKTYFSCFPLGYIEDSIDDIMNSACLMANIFKYGGGTGLDLSKIRPKGSLISNGNGNASGPLSFAKLFDTTANVISQGGRRRGANMISISSNHKDVIDIINAKDANSLSFNSTNFSITLEGNPLDNENIINAISKSAHNCGDPGVIFLYNQKLTTPFPLESDPFHVNPCAEYMAPPMTACNLISINLLELMLISSEKFFDNLSLASISACLFANVVLHQEDGYPNEFIKKQTMKFRPVGIGMTGLHETALLLGIDYNSIKEFADEVQTIILNSSLCISEYLVKDCGLPSVEIRQGKERYNTITTVQAPTGSVSQFGRCLSTGIEPLYDTSIKRSVADGDSFIEFELVSRILDKINFKPLLSHQIPAETQLSVMSTIQKNCHGAISKTVNVSRETTVEEVKQIFINAFNLGLKSITIYRDKSRESQILNAQKDILDDLPQVRPAKVHSVSGNISCYVTTTKVGDKIREVFINTGKSGTGLNAAYEALGRVISIGLRSYPDLVDKIIKTMKGVDAGEFYTLLNNRYRSIPDAVASIMELELGGEQSNHLVGLCPNCGRGNYRRDGSCFKCHDCGYSTC